MPRLALYTFGVLKFPLSDPAPSTREFYDLGEAVYRRIAAHPGYLARAEPAGGEQGVLFGADWGPWGEFAVPGVVHQGPHPGHHRTRGDPLPLDRPAVRPRRRLQRPPPRGADPTPRLVPEVTAPDPRALVGPGRRAPTWQEGVAKLEHLQDHGPAPQGFTFHQQFTPAGTPGSI